MEIGKYNIERDANLRGWEVVRKDGGPIGSARKYGDDSSFELYDLIVVPDEVINVLDKARWEA